MGLKTITRGEQLKMKVSGIVSKIEELDLSGNSEIEGGFKGLISQYILYRERCSSHGLNMSSYDSKVKNLVNKR
ncbi:MAG: hypothetical protein WDZ62_02090 [Candidatus Pacearchaeota archaeon]